ncbi:MAG: pantoate--beta-alanine ligase [Deltaproteobacteria bacterium]|nr:pantoate--beta-alanine ligase [Deltaproteobacteria bacterium]
MKLLPTRAELARACDEARASGHRVGLVPTMGALHDGHLSLVDAARAHASFVVVTIFVNPTQFGPHEDLARYPRDLDGDLARCAARGVDAVFVPAESEMYAPGHATTVHVARITETLCGPQRPGHFDGVATIVTKLFALTAPCDAIFGRKDYQQLAVIRRLATDLDLRVGVHGAPIVREPDGLAMSSRNRYLAPSDRARALALARGLSAASHAFEAGERRAGILRDRAHAPVLAAFDRVDYVDVCDPETLRVLGADETTGERALVAAAARLGGTRLIDNVVMGEEKPPLAG